MKEFSRTRRNRTILASLVLAFGFVIVVLPDIQGGTLGIGSVCFLAVLAFAYYRILDSRKRAKEGVESFPAVANAIQTIRHNSRNLAKVVGYYVLVSRPPARA